MYSWVEKWSLKFFKAKSSFLFLSLHFSFSLIIVGDPSSPPPPPPPPCSSDSLSSCFSSSLRPSPPSQITRSDFTIPLLDLIFPHFYELDPPFNFLSFVFLFSFLLWFRVAKLNVLVSDLNSLLTPFPYARLYFCLWFGFLDDCHYYSALISISISISIHNVWFVC